MDDVLRGQGVRAVVGRSVPGVAVAIVDAYGVRAQAAVGVADLASGVPASTEMSCPWFSMTKIATVTAAMRLVDVKTDGSSVKHASVSLAAMRRLHPNGLRAT